MRLEVGATAERERRRARPAPGPPLSPAPLAAIVEIAADAEGRLPVELIHAAYLASRSGPVAFVLAGVAAAAVDRVLDAVVPTALSLPGVFYCTAEDLDRLISVRGRPLVGLVSATRLRSRLRRHRVDVRPVLTPADLQQAVEAAVARWRKRSLAGR